MYKYITVPPLPHPTLPVINTSASVLSQTGCAFVCEVLNSPAYLTKETETELERGCAYKRESV